MPDTILRELASPAPGAPVSPTELLRAISVAAAGYLDGDTVRDRAANQLKMIDALRPIIGHFSVADAVLLKDGIYAASGSGCYAHAAGEALEAVAGLLEDFICSAPATGAEDVGCRSIYVMNQRSLSPRDRAVLAQRLALDIYELQHNNFGEGQLFGGQDAFPEKNEHQNRPWWKRRAEILKEAGIGD